MKANYHTHTYLCNHADGSMRDYIERAIESGIEILGFSDHVPYPFPEPYYFSFRMQPSKAEIYVNQLLTLREEYKRDIKIYIGYEAEYYPKHFDDMLNLINRYPCDYIIMGQHFTNNQYDGVSTGSPTGDINVIRQYVKQCCEAMRLGVFTYFAHPDMMTYSGDNTQYLEEMKEICITSVQTDTPLEINLLGIRDNRIYPKESFFELVGKYGCKICIGADAHSPEMIIPDEGYRKALQIVEKYNLNLIDEIPLRKPVKK